MRISQVVVHNFRSIHDLTLDCFPLVTLVGPNNAGKSNLLGAIEFALTPSIKPAIDEFFAFRESGDDTLWVEIAFVELTEQESKTFDRYAKGTGSLRIRKTATLGEGKVEVRYNAYSNQPTAWWLRASAWSRLNTRQAVLAAAQDVPALQGLADGSGRLTKNELEEFQGAYIEEHRAELAFETGLEDGPLLGAQNVAGGVLPDFFLVPAVRELADETKTKGPSLLARLLQRIVTDVATQEGSLGDVQRQLEAAVAALNTRDGDGANGAGLAALERSLERELARWGVGVSIQVEAPTLDRIFELGTKVMINDGHETAAERKGHGLQRALVFALLRTWAEATKAKPEAELEPAPRKSSMSVVFAVEEPELYLHPQAQRQLAGVLQSLSESPDRQVILCTHSPSFVDIEHYQGIGLTCKDDPRSGTVIRQCSCDLFGAGDADAKRRFQLAGWINPDRGELFFARRVILVEGETEQRVLPVLARRLALDTAETTVIDCGSKFNLKTYIELLNRFGISYLVVHDEDPLPDPVPEDWPEERVKVATRTLAENDRIAAAVDTSLGSVEILSPDFERAAGISRSKGEKMGKAMAAMNWLEEREIPFRLQQAVTAAFGRPEARATVAVAGVAGHDAAATSLSHPQTKVESVGLERATAS